MVLGAPVGPAEPTLSRWLPSGRRVAGRPWALCGGLLRALPGCLLSSLVTLPLTMAPKLLQFQVSPFRLEPLRRAPATEMGSWESTSSSPAYRGRQSLA